MKKFTLAAGLALGLVVAGAVQQHSGLPVQRVTPKHPVFPVVSDWVKLSVNGNTWCSVAYYLAAQPR